MRHCFGFVRTQDLRGPEMRVTAPLESRSVHGEPGGQHGGRRQRATRTPGRTNEQTNEYTHGVPGTGYLFTSTCLAVGRVGSRRILSICRKYLVLYYVVSGHLSWTPAVYLPDRRCLLFSFPVWLHVPIALCVLYCPSLSFSKRTHHALLSTFFAAPLSPLTLAVRCPRLSCSLHRPWSTPRIMPVAIHKTSPTISTVSLPIQVAPVLQSSRLRCLFVLTAGFTSISSSRLLQHHPPLRCPATDLPRSVTDRSYRLPDLPPQERKKCVRRPICVCIYKRACGCL